MPSIMKKWELNGLGRETLRLVEAHVPPLGPGQVLVRVSAVSLNYRDKLVIESGMGLPLQYPLVPGSDMAGEVVAVADDTSRFEVGDRVISTFYPEWRTGGPRGTAREPYALAPGALLPGVLSQFLALSEDWLTAAPASLTDLEASTLPCAGLTAWAALTVRGHIRPGEIVVVQGTGGVALFAVQLALASGARVVLTSSSDEKLERAKSLGPIEGINRVHRDWVQEVHALTDGRGADHIVELAGGANLGRSAQAAAPGGAIYLVGVLEGAEVSAQAVPFFLKGLNLFGIGVGNREEQEALVRAVDARALKPVIDSVFDIGDLEAALRRLDEGPFGKVVVSMG